MPTSTLASGVLAGGATAARVGRSGSCALCAEHAISTDRNAIETKGTSLLPTPTSCCSPPPSTLLSAGWQEMRCLRLWRRFLRRRLAPGLGPRTANKLRERSADRSRREVSALTPAPARVGASFPGYHPLLLRIAAPQCASG